MTAHALDNDDAGQSAKSAPRRKPGGKRLVLPVILLSILLVGGGAAVHFGGLLDGVVGGEPAQGVAAEVADGPGVFYQLPELLVNLNSANARRQNFLKISISIELQNQADIQVLEQVLPRIIDNFQIYLRELRIDDLRGSAGIYRLREEMLLRVSQAVHPIKVRDVLFREMLVQ